MPEYVATINIPGYLPMDDDPPVFDSTRDAWRYLYEERERDLEESGDERDWDAGLAMLARYAAADFADDFTHSVQYDTPGYDGDHDQGRAYSVSVVESDSTNQPAKENAST